jgi:ATP-dependent DNA helicase RecQ
MFSAHQILKQYWGYDNFRPSQEDIVMSVINGHDTLALLPTGGGKSICFQVPTMMKEGICIVVSPLIALMKDQVENLQKRNISAAAIYSGMSKRLIDITLDNCVYGSIKFLYVSPERLTTDIFKARVQKMNVNLIAIDEAHCISQWGYDFRPPYLKIAELRAFFPEVPLLALTATATPQVVDDIQEKLAFKQKNVLKKSFLRRNLSYSVLYEDAKLTKLVDILQKVPGTAVVYVRNRRKTKEIAEYLQKNRIVATYYHAGLTNEERATRQENWIKDKVRVIVATNAFGMGIDKPDVRVVVHMDMPESPEAYFQEAGRAGRDEKKAYAVLLFNESDKIKALRELEESMPSIAEIKNVYNALGNYFQLAVGSGFEENYTFNLGEFCNQYNFNPLKTVRSLTFLEQNESIHVSEGVLSPSRVRILFGKEDLYKFQVENKQFEGIVKFLLRSYGGILEDFVKVNEQQIAQKFKVKKDAVVKVLTHLNAIGLLEYEPQNNQPFIRYLKPRESGEDLHLNHQLIKERIEVFKSKLSAMISYAASKDKCRSNTLLAYFGEKREDRCGICDFCVGRNKIEVNDVELEKITEIIKENLVEEPHTAEYILATSNYPNKEKMAGVVHWLMEQEVIYKKDDGKLIWSKPQ